MDEGASAFSQPFHLGLKFWVNSRGLEALRVHVHHHKPPHQEPLSAVSSFYPSTGSSGSVLRKPHSQFSKDSALCFTWFHCDGQGRTVSRPLSGSWACYEKNHSGTRQCTPPLHPWAEDSEGPSGFPAMRQAGALRQGKRRQ